MAKTNKFLKRTTGFTPPPMQRILITTCVKQSHNYGHVVTTYQAKFTGTKNQPNWLPVGF